MICSWSLAANQSKRCCRWCCAASRMWRPCVKNPFPFSRICRRSPKLRSRRRSPAREPFTRPAPLRLRIRSSPAPFPPGPLLPDPPTISPRRLTRPPPSLLSFTSPAPARVRSSPAPFPPGPFPPAPSLPDPNSARPTTSFVDSSLLLSLSPPFCLTSPLFHLQFDPFQLSYDTLEDTLRTINQYKLNVS